MMIFSIISPACVSKLGWSCGRLSMDRGPLQSTTFKRCRRWADVCRRAKQVPCLPCFSGAGPHAHVDIDVKGQAPFTNDILLGEG